MVNATIAGKYLVRPRNTWTGDEKIPLDVNGVDGVGLASTLKDHVLAGVTSRTRFYANIDNGAAIATPRVFSHQTRIFVGAAVDYSTLNQSGNATFGWLGPTVGPSYLPRDASVAVVNDDAGIAISGASRSSDVSSGQVAVPIGVAGFGLADAASSTAYAFYGEAIRQGAGSFALGLEVDVRNASGQIPGASQPYSIGSGPHGLWIACGPGSGTGGYGPAPTNDSGAAMVVLQNQTGSNAYKFSQGIIFRSESLSGVTGADGDTGRAGVLDLARGHEIRWYSSDGTVSGRLGSRQDNAAVDVAIEFTGGNVFFYRNGLTEVAFEVMGNASAVNYLRTQNQVAGAAPSIDAVGTDTNINISLTPVGGGVVRSGQGSFAACNAVAIPAGGTAGKGYMLSSTANFGVFFGSGAPTLSAAKGSWYMRSDGSAPNNRAYINTDGSTAYEVVPTTVEGTFIPTLAFATPGDSSWAYATQTGTYTKMGRLVTFALTVTATPTIGTGSGDLQIGNLPFTCSSTIDTTVSVDNLGANFTWPTGTTFVSGRVVISTKLLLLRCMGSATGAVNITAANMATGAAHTINLAGHYEV